MLELSLIVALSAAFFSAVWFDTEIAAPIRSTLQRWTANAGWREEVVDVGDREHVEIVPRGRTRAPARWAWNLISCPLCIGTHVCWWVSAYSTGSLWSKTQWLVFGAASGVYYFLSKLWQNLTRGEI